jgi:eukaryotic-like serine/threonine-protein kinase
MYALRSDARGNISVRRIADDEELLSLPGADVPVIATEFSPDGRYLAAQYGTVRPEDRRVFKVWNLQTGGVHLTTPFAVRYAAFKFSNDGRLLVVGAVHASAAEGGASTPTKGSVLVYDLERPDAPTRELSVQASEQFAFHPDGRRIALTNDSDNAVEVYDLETGAKLLQLSQPDVTRGVDWSPDGTLLAAGSRWDVLIWDVEKRESKRLPGHLNQVTHVAFNHRGDLLASRSWDYTIRLWDVASRRELISTSGGSDWTPPVFSDDDRRLAFVRDGLQISLLNVAGGSELRRLTSEQPNRQAAANSDSPYRAIDFSHDGQWLVRRRR